MSKPRYRSEQASYREGYDAHFYPPVVTIYDDVQPGQYGNPYEPSTPDYAAWQKGWSDAYTDVAEDDQRAQEYAREYPISG